MSISKKIIIIGPSGVGKSAIGEKLAQRLGYFFMDSDRILHDELSFPVSNSYTKEEFDEKKELELKILKNVLKSEDNVVFSTCGGLVENQGKNRLNEIFKILRQENYVILLLPYENLVSSQKFLMKRFNIKFVTKDMALEFRKAVLCFKQITDKIVYVQTYTPRDIVDKILEII